MARNWGMAPFETIDSKGTAVETATGESFFGAEDSGSSKFVIVVWPRELSLWLMSFSFLCSEYSFQCIGRLRGYGNPPEKNPTVPWKPLRMTDMTRSKSLQVYMFAEEENTSF